MVAVRSVLSLASGDFEFVCPEMQKETMDMGGGEEFRPMVIKTLWVCLCGISCRGGNVGRITSTV